MSAITFENIFKSYRQTFVLNDVSLILPAGQTTAIVGESGSGKSTLLQLVNGLVRPDRGIIRIEEKELNYQYISSVRKKMGYVVQGAGLFPHLTIRENITLLARLSGWHQHAIDERYDGFLEAFGLNKDLSERYPHSLSGGQQQRVGLCRAMILDPKLLLLDEPFSALDPITREAIYEKFLQVINREKSILLVTHDMNEALKLASYLVILRNGKVIQEGDPYNVANHPVNQYVERFFVGAHG
ncbi:MAG: ATP-binding cassette domain-containing protein [Candidatus Azotimanducaceae bacterium]|uniref:ATP-binding cassette domain-containing protein n=1 Tax=OM182 bacterium TaxID=2510334 RepID=A0A520S4V2_9GAMM|nr:ABC transporter ATP-binding protein [Gammaproteobacteria bacterium]OUV68306.1 MAG: hypothetical protein CBC93_02975 [Gammaproteobacteria bacterium TMED133]RZO77480.1 MAG: ATP-binding cassette domain-containing protein [OM182 bacterium]